MKWIISLLFQVMWKILSPSCANHHHYMKILIIIKTFDLYYSLLTELWPDGLWSARSKPKRSKPKRCHIWTDVASPAHGTGCLMVAVIPLVKSLISSNFTNLKFVKNPSVLCEDRCCMQKWVGEECCVR